MDKTNINALVQCAEVTVVFNTFQVFVAGELCDLCRWHIIFTEGLNHGFPSAVIAQFIVLKARFL